MNIYEIRGQKVMFDSDLAALYGVELRALNQAVKRNIERFPNDFMYDILWIYPRRTRLPKGNLPFRMR
jgi:hypothetical protein